MRLSRQRRQLAVPALIVIVALFAGLVAVTVGIFDQNLQTAAYDALLLVAPTPPTNQVTIVGMDDATIERYGRWPLPRRAYAEVLRVVREARPSVIGFDVGFYDPSGSEDDDRLLASEMRAAGNVILAMQGRGSYVAGGGALSFSRLEFPIPILREAAMGLGAVNVVPEIDGRVRRTNLVITDGSDRFYALPLVVAAKKIGGDLARSRQTADSLILPTPFGERLIPVDPGGELRMQFAAPPSTPLEDQHQRKLSPCSRLGELCVVSMADVVSGVIPAELFRNRIVLVGAHSASGIPDDYPVPNSENAKMWGVEVWANAALGILTLRFPALREGTAPTLFWLAVVTLAGAALIVRFRLLGFFGALGILLTYLALAALIFTFTMQGQAPGVVHAPSVAYVAMSPFWWVVVLGYLLVEEQAAVRSTQRAFGLAVTPEIARLILELEDTGHLQLGGQVREASVLFGDIRGFTTLSEAMAPGELMATLNRYFGGMVRIVESHGGTVNKYNGDNIMVIWGAPVAVTDHARRAVRCALELQGYVVAERRKGGPDISFGFGINSGPLLAGFLGAQGRFEYTVIGDTVNVASRLTSAEIARRDQVAVSERTLRALGDDVEAIDLGHVQVKGRAEPVHCFQINRLGDIASPHPAPPPAEPVRAAAVAGYR